MGTFSRIIAYGVDHVRDSRILQPTIKELSNFSSTLLDQWRRTKLSEVDRSDERVYFDEMTINKTVPLVWRLLQSCLFAVVIMLTSVIGRILNERYLASDRGKYCVLTSDSSHPLNPSSCTTPRKSNSRHRPLTLLHRHSLWLNRCLLATRICPPVGDRHSVLLSSPCLRISNVHSSMSIFHII